MTLRRIAFWLTVAGVAVLAPVGFNLAADKLPFPGLSKLRDYVNKTSRDSTGG